MTNKHFRFTFSVPKDLALEAEKLNEIARLGKTYSETYRKLIEIGIKKVEERDKHLKCTLPSPENRNGK